ncbi:MAG: extracellular solute-binding protein [Clostridia bacterium]|nr:extracellular solute-binding protein [Clostridia bacterium]
MNKKLTKLLSLAMALGLTLSATACGGGTSSSTGGGTTSGGGTSSGNQGYTDVPMGGNPDAADTLDIYLLVHGYGQEWMKSAINKFATQTWVREKYPNFSVNYDFDSIDATASQKLSAGASINKYDVIFGVNLQAYETKGMIADLTDSVFLSDVPGEEGTKVIDKVPQRFLERIKNASADPRSDGNDSYFVVPYVTGFWSMLYNATILEQLQLEVPLTTDQFLETAAQIKTKTYAWAGGVGNTNVINNCASDNYWRNSYDLWWSQYEGIEGVTNFYEGYDPLEDMYESSAVLNQAGRLKALEVVEDILSNYSHKDSQSGNYKEHQTAFLMGDGIFHYNGDYFASEMLTEINTLKQQNIQYDIKYMKMPVISAIREKTPSIADDAELRAVIKEIDADKTWAESSVKDSVTEADFKVIAAARCLSGSSAPGSHVAVVPSYAAGKGVAADFLRYLYTDEAIKDFTISSGGILFPSTYDIANDAEVMQSVQAIHKSKMELLKGTEKYPFTYSIAAAATTLGRAGLESLYYAGKFEVNFVQTGTNKQSAAEILQSEKNHWNKNTWDQMVAASQK